MLDTKDVGCITLIIIFIIFSTSLRLIIDFNNKILSIIPPYLKYIIYLKNKVSFFLTKVQSNSLTFLKIDGVLYKTQYY